MLIIYFLFIYSFIELVQCTFISIGTLFSRNLNPGSYTTQTHKTEIPHNLKSHLSQTKPQKDTDKIETNIIITEHLYK